MKLVKHLTVTIIILSGLFVFLEEVSSNHRYYKISNIDGSLANNDLELSKLHFNPSYTSESQALDPFLDQLAEDTWAYLSSDWATSNNLPWSWRSETVTGGDYANPAEIGFYALSWLIAYDMQQLWSPNWALTEAKIIAVLDQLRAWQTGSQSEQPNGPNAYNNSVFYQWYYVSSDPPVVGASPEDHLVPSVDNAWLAASLITIREYAEVNGHDALAQKSDDILTDMDFTLWYNEDTHLFTWGDIENPSGGGEADYYSNENRIINFIARSLGNISATSFLSSLSTLTQPPGTYNTITVEKIAWDGSYFTYASPALFVNEMALPYGVNTILPAAQAQMAYAQYEGYAAWGLSDSFDIGDGDYVKQGAPPVAKPDDPESRPGLVTPHGSALALITPAASDVITNLQTISDTFECAYDSSFGFSDSVMTNPVESDYNQCSSRFSALAQEWIFLSLANYRNGFIWDYFYRDNGVVQMHKELAGEIEIYLPVILTPPPTLMVASFDTCNNINDLGGLMGAAYNSPDFMLEKFIQVTGRGCVAKLTYDIEHWAAFWMKIGYANLTDYNTLTFDIKADAPIPNEMKLELKRYCGSGDCEEISVRYVSGITNDWQTMRVSLADFGPIYYWGTPPVTSWTNMEELVFTFEQEHSGSNGVVYLDNIRFENIDVKGLDYSSKIVYAQYVLPDLHEDIFIMSLDGQVRTNITNTPNNDETQPAWSSDGTKIAFSCNSGDQDDICVMNADGSGIVNLTNHPAQDYAPAWSPDDTKIAFATDRNGNHEIYVMNIDGSGLTNLSNHPAIDSYPDWSSNNKKFVFHSNRDGNYEIYSMNIDGTAQTRLTHDLRSDVAPRWSPDSTKIAYYCTDNFDIYIMDSDGSNSFNLTRNYSYEAAPATWTNNNKMLAYLSNRNNDDAIYVTVIDGFETVMLMRTSEYISSLDWSPSHE